MPRAALALAVGLMLVGAAIWFVPYLTDEREVPVSTPGTAPLFLNPALIEIREDERACATDVLLDPDADLARFRVGTYREPGAPLEVTLSGPGYRERAAVPGGYPDNAVIDVPVEGPPRELIGRACIENVGEDLMGLYATQEVRTQSRIEVTVDGESSELDLALAFYEEEPQSIAARLPAIMSAATVFRPIGPWLAWPLLVLLLAGIPALALWALWRAFSRTRPDGAERRTPPGDTPATPGTARP